MKRRENRVAATYKPLTASERSILRMRGNKRRASIQRGVVRVHFVKLVAADAPRVWPAVPTCRQCGGYVLPTETVCAGCWAASIDPPSPPWNSQAVCYKVGCNRSGVHEFEMAFWCDEHFAEFQPSPPWEGGAA